MIALYKNIFEMTQDYNYSMTEIESMIVYERDLMVDMIKERLKREDGRI